MWQVIRKSLNQILESYPNCNNFDLSIGFEPYSIDKLIFKS